MHLRAAHEDLYLTLAQGNSLSLNAERYGFRHRLPLLPGLNGNPAGLLWPCGFALATAVAALRLETAKFMEVASGTGLPSLVALRKGYEVLATDLNATSGSEAV